MCIGSTDKVCLHVVYATLGVHQILVLLTFNLNHAHDHTVNHVDGLTLVVLTFNSLFVVFDSLPILVDIVLNHLAVAFIINALLATLVVLAEGRLTLVSTRLKINVNDLILCTRAAIFVAVLSLHWHLLLLLLRVTSEVEVIGVKVGMLRLLTQGVHMIVVFGAFLQKARVRDGTLALALKRWQIL